MTDTTNFMLLAQVVDEYYEDQDDLGKAKRLVMYVQHKQKQKDIARRQATLKRIIGGFKR